MENTVRMSDPSLADIRQAFHVVKPQAVQASPPCLRRLVRLMGGETEGLATVNGVKVRWTEHGQTVLVG